MSRERTTDETTASRTEREAATDESAPAATRSVPRGVGIDRMEAQRRRQTARERGPKTVNRMADDEEVTAFDTAAQAVGAAVSPTGTDRVAETDESATGRQALTDTGTHIQRMQTGTEQSGAERELPPEIQSALNRRLVEQQFHTDASTDSEPELTPATHQLKQLDTGMNRGEQYLWNMATPATDSASQQPELPPHPAPTAGTVPPLPVAPVPGTPAQAGVQTGLHSHRLEPGGQRNLRNRGARAGVQPAPRGLRLRASVLPAMGRPLGQLRRARLVRSGYDPSIRERLEGTLANTITGVLHGSSLARFIAGGDTPIFSWESGVGAIIGGLLGLLFGSGANCPVCRKAQSGFINFPIIAALAGGLTGAGIQQQYPDNESLRDAPLGVMSAAVVVAGFLRNIHQLKQCKCDNPRCPGRWNVPKKGLQDLGHLLNDMFNYSADSVTSRCCRGRSPRIHPEGANEPERSTGDIEALSPPPDEQQMVRDPHDVELGMAGHTDDPAGGSRPP